MTQFLVISLELWFTSKLQIFHSFLCHNFYDENRNLWKTDSNWDHFFLLKIVKRSTLEGDYVLSCRAFTFQTWVHFPAEGKGQPTHVMSRSVLQQTFWKDTEREKKWIRTSTFGVNKRDKKAILQMFSYIFEHRFCFSIHL